MRTLDIGSIPRLGPSVFFTGTGECVCVCVCGGGGGGGGGVRAHLFCDYRSRFRKPCRQHPGGDGSSLTRVGFG